MNIKPKLVALAVARQVAMLGVPAEPQEGSPNWIRRLFSMTVHPKVPQQVKDDIRRLLAERALLKEYREASRAYQLACGGVSEGLTLEEAVKIERTAEERLEKAEAACNGYGVFE